MYVKKHCTYVNGSGHEHVYIICSIWYSNLLALHTHCLSSQYLCTLLVLQKGTVVVQPVQLQICCSQAGFAVEHVATVESSGKSNITINHANKKAETDDQK